MRSKFDGYVTQLQMGCYIVTEDFVYSLDKKGREYGWGWSLLTTLELLLERANGRQKSRINTCPTTFASYCPKPLNSKSRNS